MLLTGTAAAAALTLLTVTPAVAATETITETVVTTQSIPADLAISIPYDFDIWGDAGQFTGDGAVTFPLRADEYDGMLTQNTFAMSSRAGEGCVREVVNFSFGYTLSEYWFDGSEVSPSAAASAPATRWR